MQHFTLVATEEHEGKTIKENLKNHFQMSARYMRKVSRLGKVFLNGKEAKLWFPVERGDFLELFIQERESKLNLNFPDDQKPLFINEDFFVISKKPGQVVHPCLNPSLEDLCSLLSDDSLHPVHRLDRDTSGLVLIALNGYTHHNLSRQTIEKKYLAIVHGKPQRTEAIIEAPIARSKTSIIERCIDPEGKYAKTSYRLLSTNTNNSYSLLECTLYTGRTHQIRVHLKHLGHPLIGDSLYGYKTEDDKELGRQALHAYYLSFDEPKNKKRITLRDPLPYDMKKFLKDKKLAIPQELLA